MAYFFGFTPYIDFTHMASSNAATDGVTN